MTKEQACPECKGTGADEAKTEEARRRGACDERSYIACWNCSGNGLDPMKFFRWNDHAVPY